VARTGRRGGRGGRSPQVRRFRGRSADTGLKLDAVAAGVFHRLSLSQDGPTGDLVPSSGVDLLSLRGERPGGPRDGDSKQGQAAARTHKAPPRSGKAGGGAERARSHGARRLLSSRRMGQKQEMYPIRDGQGGAGPPLPRSTEEPRPGSGQPPQYHGAPGRGPTTRAARFFAISPIEYDLPRSQVPARRGAGPPAGRRAGKRVAAGQPSGTLARTGTPGRTPVDPRRPWGPPSCWRSPIWGDQHESTPISATSGR